jgi:hypothetical protein
LLLIRIGKQVNNATALSAAGRDLNAVAAPAEGSRPDQAIGRGGPPYHYPRLRTVVWLSR